MKRCPQCNRVETDDTLVFCRADGTALVNDSSLINSEAGTARPSSASVPGEVETGILPHTTAANMNRSTGPTTVLPVQQVGTTSALPKTKRRTTIAIVVVLTAVIATTTAVFVNSYLSKKRVNTISSIAVMPFVNESGNADVEYLSDGMTETLINSLAQIPKLSVKARSSVFRYKGKEFDPKKIASELNVQAILTGRLVQRGEKLTLNLELIDAQTENTLWGDKYERKSSELVALQSEVARDVLGKLTSKLSGVDVAKVEKNFTANPEAYQLYLKGRYQWNRRTSESLKQAVEFYKQAIEKDPNYAQAYAGLAATYIYFPNYTIALPKDSMPLAKAAAMRALELDDSLAEAHTVLGRYRAYFEWDRDGAEQELRRAIELDPNYAWAHSTLAAVIAKQKRFDEAIAAARRGEELDPQALSLAAIVAERLVEARSYDEAIAQLKKMLPLGPNFANTHFDPGWPTMERACIGNQLLRFKSITN